MYGWMDGWMDWLMDGNFSLLGERTVNEGRDKQLKMAVLWCEVTCLKVFRANTEPQ